MKVLFDLNILLDVLQNRAAFYESSAAALSKALEGECEGIVPGHAVTTLYYLLNRHTDKSQANAGIDFVLDHFCVTSAGTDTFRRARQLPISDFEDAVVSSIAEQAQCDCLVTRNISDFKCSPVDALLPAEFLQRFELLN